MPSTPTLQQPGLLDELDVLHRQEREAQTRKLLTATAFALANADLDPAQAGRAGRERLVRLGGEGTPAVAEFSGAMVGGRLQLSAWSADRLIADGLDLQFRLPHLFARLTAFEVAVGHARLVARKTRHLSLEQAGRVDARAAEVADGRLPWSRFTALVDAAVIQADPDTAAEREREAAEDVCVRSCRPLGDAMGALFVRGPVEATTQIDAAVTDMAATLQEIGWADPSVDGDSEPARVQEIRLQALLVLCNPAVAVAAIHHRVDRQAGREVPGLHKLVPDASTLVARAQLYVHLAQQSAEDGHDGVARIEGHGPVSAGWVRRHLGLRAGFTVRPVLDPLHQTPVDAYEVPARHAEAVHLMTPADIFPFASRTTRAVEIDHTRPYRPRSRGGPPGQSRIGNYGPMSRRHHRIKTHSDWQVEQPFPGIYLWRDPAGAMYLVDHTGTRRVGAESA
ncbi:hypothetical protein D9V37_02585 [Nocardioides mangrovicus]|uniref:DUF222 domain-containing protein n=1 Tax=Nocardioides mangrovicus TaxID=2478913 RepID=A0A3L8P6H0_9ACTN|nr:hypothetical protein [Nocardioides mangrovicus]RLV50855.1 hypothetical protein D9V37_02585 [Nocardioides mangrovicus]